MSHPNSLFSQALNTPWKVYLEVVRILLHPLVIFYLKLNGVRVGRGTKWYGFPVIFRHRHSHIVIGDRVEVRNHLISNPLGVNHPLILTTWQKDAQILIGNDVGITGGTICAAEKIEIGSNSLIGANTTIIDTDFHPTNPANRRYGKQKIKSSPVKIGNNAFIGMNTLILKGSTLGRNTLVGAGSIVSRSFKPGSLIAGNPAKLIKVFKDVD